MQGTGTFLATYQYTERNQLRGIQADGWTFSYEYDPSGNMTLRRSDYNNIVTSTSCPEANYDALNRPVTWEHTGPGGFQAVSHYRYDQVNREVATWREYENSRGERFTYTATNQLETAAYQALQVWTNTPQEAERTVTYAYTPDKLNRTSMTEVSAFGGVTNYTHSALNQYTANTGNSYTYDSNFNLTHTAGFIGAYDAANRLVFASNGGSGEAGTTEVGFVYDGLGRCVKRIFDGVETVIVYDGWKPIAEFDEWGYFQAWNLYGPGADEILLRHKDKIGYLRFFSDRRGNVMFALNEFGAVYEKYKYDAFGKPTVTDGSGGNARSGSYYEHCFLFQGREYIKELGIYDYRHRFYLPALGRFLQSDPTGFSAGDMNLFRYVGDDPIGGSDPTGLVDNRIPVDRMWEMARFADSSNNSHNERNTSPAGMDSGGDSGGSKSISRESEGKKGAQLYAKNARPARGVQYRARARQGKGTKDDPLFDPNNPKVPVSPLRRLLDPNNDPFQDGPEGKQNASGMPNYKDAADSLRGYWWFATHIFEGLYNALPSLPAGPPSVENTSPYPTPIPSGPPSPR